MRSKLYLKSAAVTSRLIGGANLTPSWRWNVYDLAVGGDAAVLGGRHLGGEVGHELRAGLAGLGWRT